ncbi:MAG: response regulator [Cyanobacteria bacterium J06621_11]
MDKPLSQQQTSFSPAQPAPTASIMVVDDTPANLHLLIRLLTAEGYHLRPITDGAQALSSAQSNPPDVILLDIQMPGMDGYEVCKQLKADERTQDIPVIFLTVLDDVNSIVKGFDLGGVDYITKPVREGELLARVKNQIELRSLQQQLHEKNQQQQQLLEQYEATASALKESEEKFSKAFENTPLPTTIVNLKTQKYVDVNHAFIQRSGYAREEVIGHTAIELKLWQSLKQREIIFKQVEAQGYSHGTEIGMQTKSGEIKSIILFLELIYLKGEPYILGTGEDISQYKADQEKLTAKTREISETLETLKTTQAELIRSAKMAALGNLVAGVAHEISTPVGTALMTASTLENATRSLTKDLQKDTLKRSVFENYLEISTECSHLILNNLNRAGELVNSFKRITVDQTSRQERTFLLKSYLHEIVTNLMPQLHKTPHQINLYGSDTFTLHSDPGSIAQIITNFITNSLTHAYPGHQAGTINISFETSDNQVVLIYHDDGCGIALKDQNRIFEPFFTTARDRGGSGLGLHLVYNLVTQTLRGNIQVASMPTSGTTFTVTFPISPSPETKASINTVEQTKNTVEQTTDTKE